MKDCRETGIKKSHQEFLLDDFCRGDRTRTCDSLVPNQERYQLRYTPDRTDLDVNLVLNWALKNHQESAS